MKLRKLAQFLAWAGGALFSLVLSALLFGLIAYLWLNQQLSHYGISQWQLSLAELSSRQLVIKKLSLTINSATGPTTDNNNKQNEQPVFLQDILSLELPAFLPDRIIVNKLRINGSRVSDVFIHDSVQARLDLTRQQQNFNLQITTRQPTDAHLQVNRESQNWQVTFTRGGIRLNGQLNAGNGNIQATLDYPLNTEQLAVYLPIDADALSFKQLHSSAEISGKLVAKAPLTKPWQAVESLSGVLTVDNSLQIKHQSSFNQTGLQSQLLLQPLNWQRHSKLAELLRTLYPQLVIQQGQVEADLTFDYAWTSGDWHIDDARVKLTQADWVYDTWSATQHDATAHFSATTTHLSVQHLQQKLGSLQQGFVIGPLQANMALELPLAEQDNWQLDLQQHTIEAFGGTIEVPNQTYRLNRDFDLPLVFERLSLGELLRQYPSDNVAINGKVSGTLPLAWRNNQLTLKNGYLNALAPGGHVAVDSSALTSMAGENPSLRTLAAVLENFTYRTLSSEINYDDNGKLNLQLQLNGFNPDVEQGRPVEFNLTLQEDLPALIKGLQLTNSVNEIVRERIQENLNR